MNHHTIQVPASKALSGYTLTVEITGLRAMRVRLWLAARLIRLGAWVSGMNVHFAGGE